MTPTRLTTMRGRVDSVADGADEELITLCIDRSQLALGVMPPTRPATDIPPSVTSGPAVGVPHFRSTTDLARSDQKTVLIRRAREVNLPLGVWIIAAVVAGLVSFYVAPQARASLEHAVRGTGSP